MMTIAIVDCRQLTMDWLVDHKFNPEKHAAMHLNTDEESEYI